MKKNKIIKGIGITLGVIAFIGIAGSVVMGGYVSDKILHQNADKDTHDNSIKQLEVWGYARSLPGVFFTAQSRLPTSKEPVALSIWKR